MSRPLLLIGTSLFTATPLSAAETVTYGYDGRGRLVSASRSGTVNNNVVADYAYDDADNRTAATVAGVATPTPTPAPSFAIANAAAVTEGGTLSFTVTKSGAASSAFSVNYASGDGTALAGSDYTAASGTLTFAAAETAKTVSIATIDDAAVEAAETVLVTLSSPSGGATIATSQASGTINSNDTAGTTNTAPRATRDLLSMFTCSTATVNVTANDTDADGDLPLTLTSVTPGGAVQQTGALTAQAVSASSIQVTSKNVPGAFDIAYTIKDSRGATATGSLRVSITSAGTCPP